VVESLISSGIEDHTFGPINLREHFPEEELTLGKNRFLEVASLVGSVFSLTHSIFLYYAQPTFSYNIDLNTQMSLFVEKTLLFFQKIIFF